MKCLYDSGKRGVCDFDFAPSIFMVYEYLTLRGRIGEMSFDQGVRRRSIELGFRRTEEPSL